MAKDMIARMSADQYLAELALAGNDEKALMKHLRQGAKGVNFGLLYGSGAKAYKSTARLPTVWN